MAEFCDGYATIMEEVLNHLDYVDTTTIIILQRKKRQRIELIFYKGGEIEKTLCKELDIQSFNIENFGLEKVYSMIGM